jgi:hypothetical protein
MVSEKVLMVARVALLVVVLVPLTGVGMLGQQEIVIWVAALLALLALVIRSRRSGSRTRS